MSENIEIPEENITVEDEVAKTSILPVIAGTALGLGLAMVGASFISMWKDRNDSSDDETDVIVITEDTISPEDN